MPYLNVDLDYFDHPKTLLLVALLGNGADVLPLRLWAYCGKFHAKDGVLGRKRPIEIESVIRWWGEDGHAVRGLQRAGFLFRGPSGFAVHDWKKHQGHIWALQKRNRKNALSRWEKLRGTQKKSVSRRENGYATGMPDATTGMPLSSPLLTSPNQTERVSSAPSLSDVQGYATERGGVVNAQRFHDTYTAVGWMVNGQPVRDWKALFRKWEANEDPAKIQAVASAKLRCQRPGCGLAANWVKGLSRDGKTGLCADCIEHEAVELERAG